MPLLDGAPSLAGHGLQSGQTIDLLTELPLGYHQFSVVAVDNLGNSGTLVVSFNIIVTPQSIKDEVTHFLRSGMIKNGGIGNSLLAKLDAASSARDEGNCERAEKSYGAFINELQAQLGRGVDASAAGTMVADARYLVATCL